MTNTSELDYANKNVDYCIDHCGCSRHGEPGIFGKTFKGILFLERDLGYTKHFIDGHNRRIWEYGTNDMDYDAFQAYYIKNFLSFNHNKLFMDAFKKASGLSIDDVAFTSLVHCCFKDNQFKDDALPKCKKHMMAQINALKPDVIVAMGKTAIEFFKKETSADTNYYDVFNVLFPYPDGVRVQHIVTAPQISRMRDYNGEASKLWQLITQAIGKPGYV